MQCDLSSSIPEWMVEYPQTSRVFSDLELDTSCAGKSLQYVCLQQGLSPPAVLERLHQAIVGVDDTEER